MKLKLMLVSTAVALALVATTAHAGKAPWSKQGPVGPGGVTCPNPQAPDDDGDGIPNGIDPDYRPPRDGSGRQLGRSVAEGMGRMNWLDFLPLRYGIGIPGCPSAPSLRGNGYGPGDGSGNDGTGPGDGSGYGPGSGTGTGECDGTGPHGTTRRRVR